MQAMLKVAEIGVNTDIFVGDIVAIHIAHTREIRGIGHPKVASAPRQTLNAIEASGEFTRGFRRAVTVGVQHHDHAVARGVR